MSEFKRFQAQESNPVSREPNSEQDTSVTQLIDVRHTDRVL